MELSGADRQYNYMWDGCFEVLGTVAAWGLTSKLRWKISDGQYLLHNILIHPSTFQQLLGG